MNLICTLWTQLRSIHIPLEISNKQNINEILEAINVSKLNFTKTSCAHAFVISMHRYTQVSLKAQFFYHNE